MHTVVPYSSLQSILHDTKTFIHDTLIFIHNTLLFIHDSGLDLFNLYISKLHTSVKIFHQKSRPTDINIQFPCPISIYTYENSPFVTFPLTLIRPIPANFPPKLNVSTATILLKIRIRHKRSPISPFPIIPFSPHTAVPKLSTLCF